MPKFQVVDGPADPRPVRADEVADTESVSFTLPDEELKRLHDYWGPPNPDLFRHGFNKASIAAMERAGRRWRFKRRILGRLEKIRLAIMNFPATVAGIFGGRG